MNKIVLLAFVLISATCYSQRNSFLYDIEWYLKDGFHNGRLNPSANEEVENAILNFSIDTANTLSTSYCKVGEALIIDTGANFYFENSVFDITGDACESNPNVANESQYFSFFTENINEEFVYEVGYLSFDSPPFETWFLYINAPNGDFLYFEDTPQVFLNTPEFGYHQIVVSPNPIVNQFSLINTNRFTLDKVSLLNQTGQVIKNISSNDFDNISVEDLSSGLYFLQITYGEERTIIKKLIKK